MIYKKSLINIFQIIHRRFNTLSWALSKYLTYIWHVNKYRSCHNKSTEYFRENVLVRIFLCVVVHNIIEDACHHNHGYCYTYQSTSATSLRQFYGQFFLSFEQGNPWFTAGIPSTLRTVKWWRSSTTTATLILWHILENILSYNRIMDFQFFR